MQLNQLAADIRRGHGNRILVSPITNQPFFFKLGKKRQHVTVRDLAESLCAPTKLTTAWREAMMDDRISLTKANVQRL